MHEGAGVRGSVTVIVPSWKRKAVCVVGGGLAGGIVASTLAARGHTVSLLELGNDPAPLLPGGEIWERTEIQSPFTRGKGIGGTSNFWHGGLTVLDRTDIDGTSEGIRQLRAPITYDQLHVYYARAVALLRSGKSYSLDDIEAPLKAPAGGFELTKNTFRLKALLYPDTPFSTRPLIRQAQESNGLQVHPNIEVKRLVSSGPRHVAYAEGLDVITGASRRFPADVFVVTAGGLGSPKILLNSTQDCPPLAQLPIGKYIIDHPTGFVFKAKLRRRMNLAPLFGIAGKGYKLRYGFALDPSRLGDADFRNHILYLRPAMSMKDPGAYDFLKRRLVAYRGRSLALLDAARLMRHTDLLFDAVNFRFGLFSSTRYVSGLVFAEQLPGASSRMRRLDDRTFDIQWGVSDEDRRSLEKFLALFFQSYAELFETFTIFPGMCARLDSAAHHSGGCRMATHASEGVVDADLRVFGIDNLFVADGSVLAQTGHANTGLTISALALKCSDAVANA